MGIGRGGPHESRARACTFDSSAHSIHLSIVCASYVAQCASFSGGCRCEQRHDRGHGTARGDPGFLAAMPPQAYSSLLTVAVGVAPGCLTRIRFMEGEQMRTYI